MHLQSAFGILHWVQLASATHLQSDSHFEQSAAADLAGHTPPSHGALHLQPTTPVTRAAAIAIIASVFIALLLLLCVVNDDSHHSGFTYVFARMGEV